MDLLLLLFIVLTFISLNRTNNDECLSVDKCNKLRGILAVLIVLHHISEKTSDGLFFPFLQHLGYLIVAVFFFLSGYGLMKQYSIWGDRYFRNYWRNRIAYLLIVYTWISLLYLMFFVIRRDSVSFRYLIRLGMHGMPIATNSWYVIKQLIYYVLFWLCFHVLKCKEPIRIIIISLLILLIDIFFFNLSWGTYWYLSDLSFVVGIVYALKMPESNISSKSKYIGLIVAAIIVLSFFSILPSLISVQDSVQTQSVYVICRNISSCAFALIIVFILYNIDIRGKVWSLIGNCSLEIYLLHGLFISILRSYHLDNVPILWTVFSLALSISGGYIAKLVDNKISDIVKVKV